MTPLLFFSIISTIIGIYVGFLIRRPVWSLCDTSKCPFCHGSDLCQDIKAKKINLQFNTFQEISYNLFSTKNVYFGEYDGEKVVIKKSHPVEFPIGEEISTKAISSFLLKNPEDAVPDLKLCDQETSDLFLDWSLKRFSLEQVWSLLRTNPEPLILELLDSGSWPVPRFYGACGFVIVEQNCGLSLNNFESSGWKNRTILAKQLLELALKFTGEHEKFSIYLTDISPDNIAVDDAFKLYFIDLENAILKRKFSDGAVHRSRYFDDEDFIYDEEGICGGGVSDHNVYAVCRLLLSGRAPWPMMRGGLLHSPPDDQGELVALIEECVDPEEGGSRFRVAEELIELLEQVVG